MIDDLDDPRLWGGVAPFERIVTDRYLEAISDALHIAHGTRMNALHGRYVRSFDDRGIHPFSEAIGRAVACIELIPDLGGDFTPRALERAGVEDAEAAFRREVLLGAIVSGEMAELEQAA